MEAPSWRLMKSKVRVFHEQGKCDSFHGDIYFGDHVVSIVDTQNNLIFSGGDSDQIRAISIS